MAKYKKKYIDIEAIIWDGKVKTICDFLFGHPDISWRPGQNGMIFIKNCNGLHECNLGDYIVKLLLDAYILLVLILFICLMNLVGNNNMKFTKTYRERCYLFRVAYESIPDFEYNVQYFFPKHFQWLIQNNPPSIFGAFSNKIF